MGIDAMFGFAANAMIFVVIEELIFESLAEKTRISQRWVSCLALQL